MLTLLAVLLIALSLLWTSVYHLVIYVKGREPRNPCSSIGGLRGKLSLVIPARNEPLEILLKNLESFIQSATGIPAEAMFVIDDPVERVYEFVRRADPLIRSGRAVVIARTVATGGRNGAIVEGMKSSVGDRLMVVDADTLVNERVLLEASECSGVCVARWKSYMIHGTPVEEAMAFLTDYGSWLYYEKRFKAGFFVYPLGSGTVLSREVARQVGYWPRDAIQDDIRLGTLLASLGVRPSLLCSRIMVSVPSTLRAVRIQLSRWAYGTCNVLRRHGLLLARSPLALGKKIEALVYIMQPLISAMSAIGFVLALPAAILEHHVRLATIGIAVLVALALLAMCVESAIMSRFAREDGWNEAKSVFLMGRCSALTTLNSFIIALYALMGLLGVKKRYRITPKTVERNITPEPSIVFVSALALATLTFSVVNANTPALLISLAEALVAAYSLKRFVYDVAKISKSRSC